MMSVIPNSEFSAQPADAAKTAMHPGDAIERRRDRCNVEAAQRAKGVAVAGVVPMRGPAELAVAVHYFSPAARDAGLEVEFGLNRVVSSPAGSRRHARRLSQMVRVRLPMLAAIASQ
jgi:hypothetical protein